MTDRRLGNWYYGWNVLGSAMLFQAAVYGLSIYTFTFWVDTWVREFDSSRGQIMLAVLLAQVLSGVIAPFAGRAFDSFSLRRVITLALVVFGICQFSVGLATSIWQIIVLYAIFTALGLVAAGSMAAQILAARWFQDKRGMAMGWAATGTSIGGLLAPPLVTTLLVTVGWRQAHMIMGASVLLLIVPIIYLIVRDGPQRPATSATEPGPAAPGPQWLTAEILRSRDFWGLILIIVPLLMAFSAVQMNLAPIALDAGFGSGQAALMMSLLSGTMILGKLAFGALADHMDLRLLFSVALGFMALGLVLLNLGTAYSMLLLASISFGMAVGGYLPLLGATIGSRFGAASFGRVRGLTWPFITLSAVGAPIAGVVRDVTDSYAAALWLFLATLAIALLAATLLLQGHSREPQQAS